jgi:hypothetical protein
MAKKIKYLFCAIVVMLVSHAYINRSENIIRYKWKHRNHVRNYFPALIFRGMRNSA